MTMDLKKFYDAVIAADAKVNEVATRINTLFEQDKVEDAQKLQPELQAAKAERNAANQLYLEMADVPTGNPQAHFVPAGKQTESKIAKDLRSSPEYMQQWQAALRLGVTPKNAAQMGVERYKLLLDALSETGGTPTGEEGGFLVPTDFDGMVKELMRELVDLGEYVNVETVNTLSGWRAVESAKASSGLTKHTELAEDTTEGESPTFEQVEYTLDEYMDYLPVSNSLLQDTPVNLMNYLARWFARKLVLTHNSLILTLINAITPTNVTDPANAFAGVKTALNKTLDPAVSASASLFTNQTGLDILDQLEDGTGRPLLQPDPSNATAFRVKGRPVIVLSDAHWANVATPTRSRISIGNGSEYCTLFQRAGLEFASTTVGGKAWRSNSTEVRGIARLDCQEVDADAMAVLRVNEVKA
jgi:HK97 family phage major capsid protein